MANTYEIDFWKFLSGRTLSALGTSFTSFALPLLVYQLTGSPITLAISFAVGRIPYVLIGIVVGTYADRLERKRLMIRADLLSMLAVVSIPALSFFHLLPLWWIYAVNFSMMIFGLLFQAASAAVVPHLVSREKLVEANGRLMAVSTAANLLGPPLAGLLSGFTSVTNLLLFDGLSYIISALSVWWIHTSFNHSDPKEEMQRSEVVSSTPQRSSFFADLLEGLQYMWNSTLLRSIAILLACVNLVNSIVLAELIYFAKVHLHATNIQYSLLFTAGSIGIIMLLFLTKLLGHQFPLGPLALGALAMGSVCLIIFALAQNIWVSLVLWLLRSGLFAFFDVCVNSLWQKVVPDHLLGRVISSNIVIGSSLAPLGVVVGGYLVAYTNIALIYLIAGIFILLLCGGFALSPFGHFQNR